MIKNHVHRMFGRNEDEGFTLIELLVVVVIIGILVAIAIPLYLNYRKGAENKSAESDVRNAVPVVEQYFTDHSNAYPAAKVSSSTSIVFDATTAPNQQANVSSGNTLFYAPNGTSAYKLCAQNSDGNQWYTYDSSTGSLAKAAANGCL